MTNNRNATIARQEAGLFLFDLEETGADAKASAPAPVPVAAPPSPDRGRSTEMPDYDIPNRADIPAAPQIVKCAAMDSAIVRFARSCEQRGQGSRCEDESGRFDARAASRFKNSLLGRPASDRPWGDVAEWERAMGILETTYPLLPRPEPVKKGRKN